MKGASKVNLQLLQITGDWGIDRESLRKHLRISIHETAEIVWNNSCEYYLRIFYNVFVRSHFIVNITLHFYGPVLYHKMQPFSVDSWNMEQ